MLASEGPVLINSFASWPIALALLGSGRRLFWYVHETLRPELMLSDEEALAKLRAGVASGAIWTGDRAVLFSTRPEWLDGGRTDPWPRPLDPGGAYLPETDRWERLPLAPSGGANNGSSLCGECLPGGPAAEARSRCDSSASRYLRACAITSRGTRGFGRLGSMPRASCHDVFPAGPKRAATADPCNSASAPRESNPS